MRYSGFGVSLSIGIDVRPDAARCSNSVTPFGVRRFVLERPELCRQRARRRLQQDRQVDVIGAEAHAVFAQGGARRLVEALDLFRDLLPLQDAERFYQLERDAARRCR